MTAQLDVLAAGLTFPEGLRWHDGRLWFSDFYSHAVFAVDLAGVCEKVVDVPGQPSGLGWLPGGDLLVVSMTDQALLRHGAAGLSLHADLAALARFHCNDMIVDAAGRAYVGNFGFDPASEAPRPTTLIAVEADGRIHVAAEDLAFPNGMAWLDGGRTLVVAESVAQCLSAFDVAADGGLDNRRVFAATPGVQPDGIAATPDGDIWVTTMTGNRLLCLDAAGALRHSLDLGRPCWSCAVGGPDGDLLFVAVADHFERDACRTHRSGAIQLIKLD